MKKLYFLFLLCTFVGFSQNPGDIVITEIMKNPATISDDFGEWFEVYNTTGAAIDMNGWIIRDQPGSSQNTTTIAGSVIVPAGSYITLGRGGVTDSSDPEYNGGVTHAYVYDISFQMSNGTDEVILEANGTIIDEVYYTNGGFPDTTGASLTLDASALNSNDNDIDSNWCDGSSIYDAINDNLGTPGAENDACAPTCTTTLNGDSETCDSTGPGDTDDTYSITLDFSGGDIGTIFTVTADSGSVGGDNPTSVASGTITVTGIVEGTDVMITVDDTAGGGICTLTRTITSPVCIPAICANPGDIIITEILYDSSNPVSDTDGEWFEVYNTTGTDIDMEGWQLTDLGTNSHTIIPSGGTTIVPANGYLVLGRSTNTAENGGAPVDYAWTSYTLSNGDDEIIISCGSTEIDKVEYVDPTPTGVSWELTVSAYNSTDNDLESNWGDATSAFGTNDDFGTPGADNDFTLSINQYETKRFSVFPNPTTNGFVNITSSDSATINVVVFDILGKQISDTTLTNNQLLNVAELHSGIYMLKISQNNNTITKKLVIK